MENKIKSSTGFSSLKIVVVYIITSVIYLYITKYIADIIFPNTAFLSLLQKHKELEFIIVSSFGLFFLTKKSMSKRIFYFKNIFDLNQKSEEEYGDLFNQSPLPKWLFDIETLQFLLVNEEACNLYGYTKEEFLTMNLKDIRPEEDLQIMKELLASSKEDGSYPNSVIIRHRKKNGEIIRVKIEAKYVNYKGRKVKLFYAIDLTEELKTQNELLETNAKLKLASEIAKLGYWTVDLTTTKIHWSEEAYKIFEVHPENFELTVDTIKKLFHPEEQLDFNLDFIAKFENTNSIENERRFITNSGQLKWVLIRQNLIKDVKGNPIRLDGIFLDITNRKLYEKEILESNERFKIITKATVEAIIDWDMLNDTVVWGDGFHTIFGYDLSINKTNLWENNIHPEDKRKVLKYFKKALEDPKKEDYTSKFRFLKANGTTMFVQYKAIFIRDSNGKATRILATMIDLTEALERLNKIENQNKTLKEIAWIQSHVVRAPLANLIGLVQLLKTKNKEKNPVENLKILNYINETAEKLDKIIHDIVNKTKEFEEL